jgi:hypothetical protein
VCDLTIGRVLAQWSAESDGVWPCVTVRDILEEIGTEEILRGLETALVNKHGSYSKSFTDGGQRERDIATHYLKHAKALEIEWPRVAATLRSVAQNFERFAAREDERRDVRL